MTNLFDIIKKMNDNDIINETNNLAVSPYMEGIDKCSRGGLVTMGVSAESFNDLITNKAMCVLLILNKEKYDKLKEEKS